MNNNRHQQQKIDPQHVILTRVARMDIFLVIDDSDLFNIRLALLVIGWNFTVARFIRFFI